MSINKTENFLMNLNTKLNPLENSDFFFFLFEIMMQKISKKFLYLFLVLFVGFDLFLSFLFGLAFVQSDFTKSSFNTLLQQNFSATRSVMQYYQLIPKGDHSLISGCQIFLIINKGNFYIFFFQTNIIENFNAIYIFEI